MSVPLFPATERPRSKSPSRLPLVPSSQLPPQRNNCYQHTLLKCTVHVKNVNCEKAWGSKLSPDDALRHYRHSWDDRQREARLFVAEMRRLQEPIIREPVPEGIRENPDDESDQICEDDNSRLADFLRASYSQIPSDSSKMLEDITIDVYVWLYLGIVPEPPGPCSFFDELQTLWRSIELSSRPKHVPHDEILYLEPGENFKR